MYNEKKANHNGESIVKGYSMVGGESLKAIYGKPDRKVGGGIWRKIINWLFF